MAQLNDLLVLGNSNLLGALSVFGDITAPNFRGALKGNADTATEFSSNATVQLTGDVTGDASAKKGWNITTTLANSGVTAGSYGPSTGTTLAHSGTFSVPYYTVDVKGRITSSSTITYTLPSSGNTDKKVEQARSTSSNWRALLSHYTDAAQGTDPGSATNKVYYNEKLSFQPSTGSLYSAGSISAGGDLVVASNGIFGGDVTVQGGDITITKSTTIENNVPAKLTFTVTQADNNVTASSFIAVYDDHDSSGYGTNMVISSASGLAIGGGESAAAFYEAVMKDSAAENTYITADSNIDFYTNCDAIDNRAGIRLDASRQFYPIMPSVGGVGSLGVNDYYWKKAYLGETHFKNGHIYLEGSNSSSSTNNTTQIIFGTSDNNHVCISSNDNTLVINPTKDTTNSQIVLYLDKVSHFPNAVNWAVKSTWATRLGDPGINVGSIGQPVYFASGVPVVVDWQVGNQNTGEHNCNNVKYNFSGYYTSNGPATSLGASTNDGSLWAQAYSNIWTTQIAADYRNGSLFVRGQNNGTWQAWRMIPSSTSAGTANKIVKFTGANTIGNSNITDDGSTITLGKQTILQCASGSFNEGLRLLPGANGWSNIFFSADSTTSGRHAGGWLIGRRGEIGSTCGAIGDFTIEENSSSGANLTIHKNGGGATLQGTLSVTSDIVATKLRGDSSIASLRPSDNNEVNFGSNSNYIYFGYENRIGSAGAVSIYKFGCHSGAANATNGTIECGTVTTKNISASDLISSSKGFQVTQTDGVAGYGVGLYGTSPPYDYGIWFGKTSSWGKHGSITSDWATYFGMNANATTRGWIFRTNNSGGCVASISGGGNLALNGSATIGNKVTLQYNSSTESLNFTFI